MSNRAGPEAGRQSALGARREADRFEQLGVPGVRLQGPVDRIGLEIDQITRALLVRLSEPFNCEIGFIQANANLGNIVWLCRPEHSQR